MSKRVRNIRTVIVMTGVCLLVLATGAIAGGRPLTASLSAANEVQTPAVNSPATGTTRVDLNQGVETICWEISGSGLTGTPQAAHIHRGAAGQNGPVEVLLFGTATSLPASDCTSTPAELIKEIRMSPDMFYVNVHTVSFPNGEMRGQLGR
jgi:hypothetical protein